jgi:N-glycosylase/DNA lyase
LFSFPQSNQDEPGCVNDECERRVDDIGADRDRTLHAVAGNATAVRPRAVRVRRARATFAQTWLGRQKSEIKESLIAMRKTLDLQALKSLKFRKTLFMVKMFRFDLPKL